MWTLSCLQTHPHPLIVVDEDATLELQVKTVKVYNPTLNFQMPNTNTPKYFKSIEMVANELGFRQKLPRKRDSLGEGTLLAKNAAASQDNGIRLTVPQFDISRSASPVLGPMSARLTDDEASALRPMEMDAVADQPSVRMGARVVGWP
jgi:glucosamine-6-phosphate deaminase